MKTRTLLAATLIAAMAFTACDKNEDPNNRSDIVHINSAINEPLSRVSIDKYPGTGTFDPGDIWGLYATVGGNHVLDNSIYTVGSTTIYWNGLSETDPVTFAAHYPRIASTISNPEAYMFNAATATNPDLLVTSPVTESKSSGNDVNLTFNHVMHQLVISLFKDVGIPGNLLDAEVTLLNMKSSAKVNLLTGMVDVAAASGTDSYPTVFGGGICFVAPQKLTSGAEWIQVKLAGKTYKYKVPADLTQLESGKRVSINLTLKAGGDVISRSPTISEWVNQQPGISGDVMGD